MMVGGSLPHGDREVTPSPSRVAEEEAGMNLFLLYLKGI
jgi:hypothetical protein